MTDNINLIKVRGRIREVLLNHSLGDSEKADLILGELDDCWKELNHKLNVVIRILRLNPREAYARRLLFEINGSLCGGHPLPSRWKEDDWSLSYIYSKKVKELLAKGK